MSTHSQLLNQQPLQNLAIMAIYKQQRNRDARVLKLILITVLTFLFGIFYITYEEFQTYKQNTSFRMQELQNKLQKFQEQNLYLLSSLNNLQKDLENSQQAIQSLTEKVISLLMAQNKRSERDYDLLLQYGSNFPFSLNQTSTFFRQNFQHKPLIDRGHAGMKIKKKNAQNRLLISSEPFPLRQIHYFKVKIYEYASSMKMIGIGIMTQSKKLQFQKDNCIYCQSERMLYIYSNNGEVYNGQILSYYKTSVKSKVAQINEDSIVTVFVDGENKNVAWYVDGVLAIQMNFPLTFKQQRLYAFVDMPNLNDKVIIYNQ